jgi:kumamolisin
VISSNSKGSTSQRNVPDVSLDSDPRSGYAIFYDGKWQVAGGTSCAAPLWAAFTALVNQNRQNQGKSLLGFPSPALYSLGQSGNYHYALHDIADGSTNFYYPAVANFDEATGWGSFQGDSLIQALSQDPLPKIPTPGSGLNPPPTTGSQDNSNPNLGPIETCN